VIFTRLRYQPCLIRRDSNARSAAAAADSFIAYGCLPSSEPPAVGLVGALDEVRDRGVRVLLRVAVAAELLPSGGADCRKPSSLRS
jgi:hypothetical protein